MSMPEIPEANRIPISAQTGFTDEEAKLILEGKLMPLPETMMRFPQAFETMLERIRMLSVAEKMKLVPFVENYLRRLDTEVEQARALGSKASEITRHIRIPLSFATALSQAALAGRADISSIFIFFGMYFFAVPIIQSKAQKMSVDGVLKYEDAKKKLLKALNPDNA